MEERRREGIIQGLKDLLNGTIRISVVDVHPDRYNTALVFLIKHY